MKSTDLLGACAALAFAAAAASVSAQTPAPSQPVAMAAAKPAVQVDVIEAMRAQGQFATLLKALDAADLTERLKASPGVTIFAPTDAAFAALPAGTLDKLLEPEHAAELRKVLLHHTVNGRVEPAQLVNQKGVLKSGADAALTLDGAGGRIMADQAEVTADIEAGNGAVFAVDKVIIPADMKLGAGAN